MSKINTIDKVRKTLRARLVKSGQRGASLESLTNYAKSVKKSYNAGHVKSILKTLDVEQIDDNVFAMSR